MKISQVFEHFKERKGSQVERRRGRRRERGAKGVALQMSPATCRYPGVMGFYPGPPEKGGLELGPTRNQTRTEPEFEFSAKRRCSVQFSSVVQSCPTLCDPMNRSMPGLPVHHHLLEFTQTHIHRVSDAIQPSRILSFKKLPS